MNALPTELVESIRGELLKLVQGDLDKNLIAIGKLSGRARDLFMVLKSPEAAVKGRRRFSSSEEDGEDNYSGVMNSNPTSSSETFGAKAIREIIGAMPSLLNVQNETPSALVIAASIARDRGMTDLSAELEKKLVGHALEGERPIDKERMRDLSPDPEKLKAQYLGAAGGALMVLGASGAPALEPTPPPSAEEDDDDLEQDDDEASGEA